MIKTKPKSKHAYEIDLTGPQGNAYYILGVAQSIIKQLKSAGIDIDGNAIMSDMTSSDYEHLIEVMERNFGDYVIMYR